MNTFNPSASLNIPVQQLTNNATCWLGHRKNDHEEIAMGQTFIATTGGNLETIEVFSSIVANPGQVIMTVHSFDPDDETWGPALGSASVNFNNNCNGKWVSFKMPGLQLVKGQSYGFKLESHDSYIGVGDAVGSAHHPPFASGKQFKFCSNHSKGDAFTYFSLAFKIGLRA
jgi:hypothetical protein